MCLEVHFSRDDAAPDDEEVVFNLSICSFVRQAWKKLSNGPGIKDLCPGGKRVAEKQMIGLIGYVNGTVTSVRGSKNFV